MSFCRVRNKNDGPVTLPAPYNVILEQGLGVVIEESAANVITRLGVIRGLYVEALPDDYAGGATLPAPLQRIVLPVFSRENVAASLTDDPVLPRGETNSAFAESTRPKAGCVRSLQLELSVAAAGDVLDAQVSIDGTPVAGATAQIALAGTYVLVEFDRDEVPYAAGATVGLAITTSVSWTATTADLRAEIAVEEA